MVDKISILDLGSEDYTNDIDNSYRNLVGNYDVSLFCIDFQGSNSLSKVLETRKNKLEITYIDDVIFDGSEVEFFFVIPQPLQDFSLQMRMFGINLGFHNYKINLKMQIKEIKRCIT